MVPVAWHKVRPLTLVIPALSRDPCPRSHVRLTDGPRLEAGVVDHGCRDDRSSERSAQLAVAVLVFLARPAGAGGVAVDVLPARPVAGIDRHGGGPAAPACMRCAAGPRRLRLGRAAGPGRRLRLADLDMRQQRGDLLAQAVSIASNISKASRLYSFSGSRWP